MAVDNLPCELPRESSEHFSRVLRDMVLTAADEAIRATKERQAVVLGLQVARRAGNYAITKPGREMLFTLVDDETRYKAKPVIDIEEAGADRNVAAARYWKKLGQPLQRSQCGCRQRVDPLRQVGKP